MRSEFPQALLTLCICMVLYSPASYPADPAAIRKLQQLLPADTSVVCSDQISTDDSFIQCLITVFALEQISLWQQHSQEQQDHCTPGTTSLITDNLSMEQISSRNNLRKKLKINFPISVQKNRDSRETFEPWLDFLESNEFPRYIERTGIKDDPNDLDYGQIIRKLDALGKQGVLKASNRHQTRVSLLVGASSLVSSLPELAQISDLVILAEHHPYRTAFFNSVFRHLPVLFDDSQNTGNLKDRENDFLLTRIFGLMEQSWI